MDLKKYQKKREPSKTGEPLGKKKSIPKKSPMIFVIQKHASSRLHYDLRLEFKGILLSWAVPKGPSLNPNEKRLAIKVEDHPYEYKDFEGIIPKGHYGAGKVIIWDQGHYCTPKTYKKSIIEKQIAKGLEKGALDIILQGEKIKGAYSLVKINIYDNEQDTWLLIKKNDEYASKKDITKNNKSVVSGSTLENLTVNHKNTDIDISKIKGAKKSKLQKNVKPMLATLVHKPFDDKNWLFEIKWDGYRALAEIQDGKIRLYSRNNINFNDKYPLIITELEPYIAKNLLFDGEIVSIDDKGISRFQWLQKYQKEPKGTLIYYIFDLIFYKNYNLQGVELIKRKNILKQLITNTNHLRYCDHILEYGIEFFKNICQHHMEGTIAKNKHSHYLPGRRTKTWLKIKNTYQQEAIICGFTKPRGSREYIGSLILGIQEETGMKYIGQVGTGFTENDLELLYKKLRPLETHNSPFKNVPKTTRAPIWVKPKFFVEVSFSEWTENGIMRHPVFIQFKTKKNTSASQENSIKNNPVKITHPNKVYFPKFGYKKQDIINYYEEMADIILPHLYYRPQSLHRFPEGIEEEGFFQKDIDFDTPDFVKTYQIHSKSKDHNINYLLCNNHDSLIYMANLGCFEINPWLSTIDHLNHPDYVILDLDPHQISFKQVVKTAITVHEITTMLEVKSYCKTSGKKGMHIYFPLKHRYSYKTGREFIHLIAKLVLHRLPQITSLERNPEKRKNKIYLDYLQNRKSQTIAAPYCIRPTPEATISTPLDWNEVNEDLDPKQFTIKTVPTRVKSKGDIFKDVLSETNDIEKVISKMETDR